MPGAEFWLGVGWRLALTSRGVPGPSLGNPPVVVFSLGLGGRERERERERALLGTTVHNGGSGAAPAARTPHHKTLEFWVRFPNERNQGKLAHPVLKYRVLHGSQPRPGWAPDPPGWLGSDPVSAWWLDLAPATLESWVRFPNERNLGKQAHPVLKYLVPHGSQ